MQKHKRFKLNPLAAGIALALAGGAAQAATFSVNPEIQLNAAGASALRLSFGATIWDLCDLTDLTTKPAVAFQDSTTGSNHRGYYCTLKAVAQDGNMDPAIAGKRVFVWKRDAGGSSRGVQPVAVPLSIARMALPAFPFTVDTTVGAPNGSSCTTTTGFAAPPNGPPVGVTQVTCTTTTNDTPDFGLADVEPALFVGINKDTISDPDWTPALATNVQINTQIGSQAFGVAVNKTLYDQLQTDQGVANPADDLPGPNQPSLSAADIRAALSGGKQNVTALGVTDTFANDGSLRVCRRVNGSGTQAASNAYFMEFPCNTGGALLPANNVTDVWSGNDLDGTLFPPANNEYAVIMNSGSGNVSGCLNDNNTKNTPALGVLSLENLVGSNNWRYVKIDGMSPNHDVNGNSPTAGTGAENFMDNPTNLKYDFVMEFTSLYNNAQIGTPALALWEEIQSRMIDPAFMYRTSLADTTFLPGLAANPLNGFTPSPDGTDRPVMRGFRNGNTCSPWAPAFSTDPQAGDDAS